MEHISDGGPGRKHEFRLGIRHRHLFVKDGRGNEGSCLENTEVVCLSSHAEPVKGTRDPISIKARSFADHSEIKPIKTRTGRLMKR